MRLLAWVLVAPSLLTLLACATHAAQQPVPAVLTNPSEQSRMELSRIVGKALHRPAVLLAPDALTHESTLIVEPVRPRDANGLPLNGRELGRPEHFRLVKQGSHCILIHERTGKHWILSQTCGVAS